MSELLLSASFNEYASPVPVSKLRAGQFFRLKNFMGEWSTALHLVVDVCVESDQPLLRRYYNFTTGQCYGPAPDHWQCYVLDAQRTNGVGGFMPVLTFDNKT